MIPQVRGIPPKVVWTSFPSRLSPKCRSPAPATCQAPLGRAVEAAAQVRAAASAPASSALAPGLDERLLSWSMSHPNEHLLRGAEGEGGAGRAPAESFSTQGRKGERGERRKKRNGQRNVRTERVASRTEGVGRPKAIEFWTSVQYVQEKNAEFWRSPRSHDMRSSGPCDR